jgi:hypothetical protein
MQQGQLKKVNRKKCTGNSSQTSDKEQWKGTGP